MTRTELRQYNPEFDRTEKDVNFLSKHLETHLKERFNVLLSTVEYGLDNGHLVRQGSNEPFMQTIKRGRDYVQSFKTDETDTDRENAEVTGFEKIDSFLSNPATPVGAKMLSISPRGGEKSKYQHNFYDIFTLKEKDGKRQVELARFSSGLTPEDYARRLVMSVNPKPEEFLANPVKLEMAMTPEEIHQALHVNHEFMANSDFNYIWGSSLVQLNVKRYLSSRDARTFNAVLNAADEVWENLNRKNRGEAFRDYSGYIPTYGEIRSLEEKKVRQAGGQCPGKSGADISSSPFSVSEFANLAPDKFGNRSFECPECGKTNVREENELLKNCQHCGSGKVAC